MCVCSIMYYRNINEESTYLSYEYSTVLFYLHCTYDSVSTAILVTVLTT